MAVRNMLNKQQKVSIGVGCTVITIILLINALIGGFCFDYGLFVFFGKNLPFWADMLVGLFLGEIAIPAAILAFILQFFLSTPIFS